MQSLCPVNNSKLFAFRVIKCARHSDRHRHRIILTAQSRVHRIKYARPTWAPATSEHPCSSDSVHFVHPASASGNRASTACRALLASRASIKHQPSTKCYTRSISCEHCDGRVFYACMCVATITQMLPQVIVTEGQILSYFVL